MADEELCPFCGGPKLLELFEAWADHEFMIETCCAAQHEAACIEMAADGKDGAALARDMGAEELLGGRLRRVSDCDGRLLLDWHLTVTEIRFGAARDFVQRHHEHCGPPAGWRWGHAIWNGPSLIGVAMVGRPVARKLDATRIVEVSRLCINRTAPAPLRWNAASMLLGAAGREAERRGFLTVVTYTLEAESGVSMRAAGFVEDGRSKGGSWSRGSRPRADKAPTSPKIRWRRDLAPRTRSRTKAGGLVIWISRPEDGADRQEHRRVMARAEKDCWADEMIGSRS